MLEAKINGIWMRLMLAISVHSLFNGSMLEYGKEKEPSLERQAYLDVISFIRQAKKEAVKKLGYDAVIGKEGELKYYFQSKILLGPSKSHELLFEQRDADFHLTVRTDKDAKSLDYSQYVIDPGEYSRVEFVLSQDNLSISGVPVKHESEVQLESTEDAAENLVHLMHLVILDGKYIPKPRDLPSDT